ncbi:MULTISPECIES: type II toxin-antitoxin system VapC family toxin [unclassified Dolichospermum]|uniref:type II toxin-antitoxin system VapC family toxin n=1 Tax=unclassified Dolichospermum TaxID=2622029 RepID=UPI001446EBF3|nr:MULTISPECIES: type II toxin-antitoxin system VapC family toxin [unclassified Dolichospermum]MBS9388854.1 type II toxin-antitoxin system VapC family toxin [Dolichospermum sp. WA123]MTJ18101.1 type II toxin-antitoxin system VapC family toxin [Dolichospermum sp. UHCC 0299]MTJ39339.1 type II toxin-antitoxin system VapC family toxin [Dolichospermum sp. UHCC 0406]
MYLLDTNICIAILKANENVVSQFHEKYQSCYLSSLVLAELYKGVYCSTKVERNLDNLKKFANLLAMIDFDEKAAIEFGKIQNELRKIGKPTGQLDALIAAVAISQNYILVTDNTRDFENITNLILENWLKS